MFRRRFFRSLEADLRRAIRRVVEAHPGDRVAAVVHREALGAVVVHPEDRAVLEDPERRRRPSLNLARRFSLQRD